MIRLLDIIFSFLSLILFSPLFILIFFVGFFDTSLPLFIQKIVSHIFEAHKRKSDKPSKKEKRQANARRQEIVFK
jgi:lipopolysaccharide/colanic/teichoic acid biosynthesis glycosyltransferase